MTLIQGKTALYSFSVVSLMQYPQTLGVKAGSGVILARTDDEARGIAAAKVEKDRPSNQGWKNTVEVFRIETSILEAALTEIKKDE